MTVDWLAAGLVVAAVAAGYLLEVQLPWRGRMPLGHAAVIALAVLAEPLTVAVSVACGLAIASPVFLRRAGGAAAMQKVARLSLAAAAAVAVTAVLGALPEVPADRDVQTFLDVTLAGAAYLAVDFRLASGRVMSPALREVLPLHVVLVCAAALLAIAHEHYQGLVAPLIAALPLVVIRFSFERYAVARRTYEQTSQALGLLPEVAGITPLGHGTRSGVYAERLAEWMALEPQEVERVTVAARLHHIGDVSLHEPDMRGTPVDTDEVAMLSEDMLRETVFLADVAPVVAAVQRTAEPAPDQLVAIVRVASTLDDLTGDWDDVEARFDSVVVELLARHNTAIEREAAIALIALLHKRPAMLSDGKAATAAIALAARGH